VSPTSRFKAVTWPGRVVPVLLLRVGSRARPMKARVLLADRRRGPTYGRLPLVLQTVLLTDAAAWLHNGHQVQQDLFSNLRLLACSQAGYFVGKCNR
jgi:hypothetical protein